MDTQAIVAQPSHDAELRFHILRPTRTGPGRGRPDHGH
jgi:hypothetical protein